jgi:hypothetical protein
MRDGIRFCYAYTETYRHALTLYGLSLSGKVKQDKDPQFLFPMMIERAKEDIQKATIEERKYDKKIRKKRRR